MLTYAVSPASLITTHLITKHKLFAKFIEEQLLVLLILKSNSKCTSAGTRQQRGLDLGISLCSYSLGFTSLKFCVTTCRVLVLLMVLIADRMNECLILLIWCFTIDSCEYDSEKFAPLFHELPHPCMLEKAKGFVRFRSPFFITISPTSQLPFHFLLILLWLYVVPIVVHYFVVNLVFSFQLVPTTFLD